MISRFDETRRGLDRVIRAAFTAAAAKGLLPAAEPAAYVVEIPADPKNGDFSTNAAMVNARAMRCAPQKIAAALLECFDFGELPVERCEMAGPGCINFYMKQPWFGALPAAATTAKTKRSWWNMFPPTPPAPCIWAMPAAAPSGTAWRLRWNGAATM